MKAFALVAPGNFGWADVPDESRPGAGEVVVHPVVCGICASDVHYWLHGRIGDQIIREYPYVLGHECAGVVVTVGKGVTRVRPGTRVAIEPGVTCGECAPCRAGRENICPNVKFLATPPYHGAMRERFTTIEKNVEPIPDSMSFEAAALCEPFGVGIHAARLCDVQAGDTIAVFGAGSIGLSTAIAARCRGAKRIIIAEPVPERRAFAESIGFEAIDIDGDPVEKIKSLTDGGVDVAFEAAGSPQAIRWTMLSTKLGGKAVIIGIPVEDEIIYDIHKVRRAELVVYNCRRSNRTLAEAIAMICGPAADAQKMATHRFAVDDTERAFDLVSKKANGVIKAMLVLDAEAR